MIDNWNVVEVIIALVGLFFCVAKPIMDNVKTTERLISSIEKLSEDLKELEKRNSDTHGRLFKRVDEHDERLDSHEVRIKIVENKLEEDG